MRNRLVMLLALIVALPLLAVPTVGASPVDHYTGPYFGEDNFPPGCIRDMSRDNPDNVCHHMRTGLNKLDSPKVDVLVLVPVSPTAERDLRIMVQSVQMWDGGIRYLAREMGLDWLAEGAEFRIVFDHIDPILGSGEVDYSTYPLWDPEIVVIASNPVGGVGIGVDPLYLTEALGIGDGEAPCHGIQNPFDFAEWEALPGFDNHHGLSGTYSEDCDGGGGNTCFAINGAIDPLPEDIDFFNLFDLVSHEFGHCLTLGHVGDGAEGDWGVVPTNDIMAYHDDPPGLNKCVSTLDVEAFAARMSHYLDTDGDGDVDADDVLLVNDQVGEGGNAFQVQHPGDHLYASSTGSPLDCPQPYLGLVPGEPTDWEPEPVHPDPVMTVTSPDVDTVSGGFTVAGTVERLYEGEEATTEADATSSSTSLTSGTPLAGVASDEVEFEHPDGNILYPQDSTLGAVEGGHWFDLEVAERSQVEFFLNWTDVVFNDLDLFVTGAATGSSGSFDQGEHILLGAVEGTLQINVDPYLVTDPVGTTYTLTAVITPLADEGDDPSDPSDPVLPPTTEQVTVLLDGALIGSQDVRTYQGADAFEVPVDVRWGTYTLEVVWDDDGEVLASQTQTITVEKTRGNDRCHPKHGC